MQDKTKSFPITSVSYEDVERAGFDISALKDEDMEELANEMADAYVENNFWQALEIIAEEKLGFAKLIENNE